MAQIIELPTMTPVYTVIIAAERQPSHEIIEAANGRKVICITASS